MIGEPDVVVSCRGSCREMMVCQESIKTFSSSSLHPVLDQQSESPRGEDPQVADWDLELKSKLLIVEGNIGVGKTTLSKKLADKLGYQLFLEPTTENPYLGKAVGSWWELTGYLVGILHLCSQLFFPLHYREVLCRSPPVCSEVTTVDSVPALHNLCVCSPAHSKDRYVL